MKTSKKINMKSVSEMLSDRELKSIVAGRRDCGDDDCDGGDDSYCRCTLKHGGHSGSCRTNEWCKATFWEGSLCECSA